MKADRALSVALAACCLVALGASAATLDASVDTTPDDAIDLNVESLPLPSDEAAELKQQVQSAEASPRQESQSSPRTSDSGTTEATQQAGAGSDTDDAAATERQHSLAADDGTGPGPVPPEPTLLERLLALLHALIDLLVTLLPLAALLGLGAAAVRFRDRLRALFQRLRARLGFEAEGDTDAGASAQARPEPANEVESAWLEMVRRTGTDELTRTPRRHADAAVEAGVEPADAETLTTLFERVRYGGEPVTAGRRMRAKHAIQRVRGQLRGGERR